ncbi:phosphatase PAP2 family protein [Thermobifida halotolerans]|uniref:Phosphatase PAP2 family protein n=1 Tax=Thermobifida halotolerans TaxID=483545 RepID=A0A399G0Y5_9ACTN|nr:phosphatase PAP2 family protein [Thermobifida halotolerans]UOE19473.1 phosphatase PAP2 family protein [Thermobifida halotolerans]
MTSHRTASPDGSPARPLSLVGWLAAAVAALAVVTWQVLVQGPLTALDWPVHALVDPRQPEGPLLALAVAVARLGQRLVTVPLLVGLGLWAVLRGNGPRPILAVLTGLGSLAVMGTLLKVAVGRTPPVLGVDVVAPGWGNVVDWAGAALLSGAGSYEGYVSFPSGHSANAALTYPLAAWLLFGGSGLFPHPRRLRFALGFSLVPVAAVGTMMTVLDYHWLSESLGGWLLGAVVLLTARLVLGPGSRAGSPGRGGNGRVLAGGPSGKG